MGGKCKREGKECNKDSKACNRVGRLCNKAGELCNRVGEECKCRSEQCRNKVLLHFFIAYLNYAFAGVNFVFTVLAISFFVPEYRITNPDKGYAGFVILKSEFTARFAGVLLFVFFYNDMNSHRPLSLWCSRKYFIAHTGGILLKVFDKKFCQMVGFFVVGFFVCPCVARVEDFSRNIRTAFRNLNTKYRVFVVLHAV